MLDTGSRAQPGPGTDDGQVAGGLASAPETSPHGVTAHAAAPLGTDDPRQIGPYPVVGLLGSGDKGRTYLGEADDGLLVVVKLLRLEWIEACGGPAGLIRSVTTARRLPGASGVAPVLDALLSGGEPYVVSAFVVGPSVQALVAGAGALPGAVVAEVAETTASALATIHDAGLAHGDVHPRSVVVGPLGPRLVGVGLCPAGPQRPASPRLGGQPLPVRVRTTRIAQRQDVRAWAATMAYAATGDAAFLALTGKDADDVRGSVRLPSGGLRSLPVTVADVVREVLDGDPAARPTARHVLDRLRSAPDAAVGSSDGPAPAGHRMDDPDGDRAVDTAEVPVIAVADVPRTPSPAGPGRLPAPSEPRDLFTPSGAFGRSGAASAAAAGPAPSTSEAPTMEVPIGELLGLWPDGQDPGVRSRRKGAESGSRRRGRGTLAGAAVGVLAGCLLGAGAVYAAVTAGAARPGQTSPPAAGAPVVRGATGGAGTSGTARRSSSSAIRVAPSAALAGPTGLAGPGDAAGPAGLPGTCTAVYDVVQTWPGGFKAEVTVTAGEAAVHGWQVTWPLTRGQAVTQSWNASIVTGPEGADARNAAYNGTLGPGARTTFGFIGTHPGTPATVTCTAE